ncbi:MULTISPECIES: FAD:protein FMN transferase [Enterobacter]|uniref:FAD:protein FMN transferase n=1 Tax=Enterobacter rongchengensis TaxID=3030999 RepID=A0ABV4JHC4_9ENTR|nr:MULTISPECIES: FAD:protein FMN transferase [Enterobacter]PNL51462.1 FAD:protein FMN transferase [Enterobacter hormaechei]HCR0842906.1 FAD:protein FMN transferase [Enterobacter cancerogenus]EKX4011477.1 FAD:protein FMN transferase [Enterobacter cloacae]ELV3043621.1 FAD:protein FMN transferase [Enterobacter chengduensis]KJM01213.1 thiamine biosynthesis protein ApbE [Enterobacter chengduensis]
MSDNRVYSYSAVLMGSPILLKLFSHDEALASRVFRLIKQYEDLLTVNRARSQVMDINHAAGQHPVVVSRAVFELIRCAKAASLFQDSAFNLAIGPLVKRWKIGFQGDSVPPADEIAALLEITHPEDVILDEARSSVFLTRAGMEIDLGAIAKGYIADRVRDYLHKEGTERGLINLGGNVQTLGSPEGGWSVGLKKPFTGEALIGAMTVENRSVVTSGTYERYFEQNGRRYHHILDPRTGYPLDNELDSVTIISKDSIDGDIWTTLMYGMGVEKGCAVLRSRPDIEAIFVTKTKEVAISSMRHFRFTLLDNTYRVTDSTA